MNYVTNGNQTNHATYGSIGSQDSMTIITGSVTNGSVNGSMTTVSIKEASVDINININSDNNNNKTVLEAHNSAHGYGKLQLLKIGKWRMK